MDRAAAPQAGALHPLKAPVVVVCGPTASGKSELAQRIAEHLGASVLSADSMQIYRGMDVGTGKVLPAEQRVPHFGIDIVRPGEPYSASLFQRYGRGVVDGLDAEGRPCIVCGGTGFYIRAVLDDYRFPAGDQVGNAVRDRYNSLVRSAGPQAVWRELNARDPESAALIHPNDAKRVVRAFELLEDGTSYARQHAGLKTIRPFYPAVYLGLAVEPSVLRARIDARVERMFDNGLVEEVRGLLDQGLRGALTAGQAIGYKQVVAFLDGAVGLEACKDQIKVATHQYAKRQRTWFRKDARITWLGADELDFGMLTKSALRVIGRTIDALHEP